MRHILRLGILLLTVVSLAGCTTFDKMQKVHDVVAALVPVVQSEVPLFVSEGSMTSQEGDNVLKWVQGLSNLNDSYQSCINAVFAQKLSTQGKYFDCFNSFALGLSSPQELALLRIVSPKGQQQAQLWLVATITAINAVAAIVGESQIAVPNVGPSPSSAELRAFRVRIEGK